MESTRRRRSDVRLHEPFESWKCLPSEVWDNVYGFDYSPLKVTALSEPLVDTVEMKAVVTDPTAVATFDLNTVSAADLSFGSPFVLDVQRNDFIHAIIAWFDIDFTACHKPIRFSTGPHTKYTHWKQTVFYLNDALTVERGERVRGHLSNKPNEKNKRDLDIALSYQLATEDPMRTAEGKCEYKMYVRFSELTMLLTLFSRC